MREHSKKKGEIQREISVINGWLKGSKNRFGCEKSGKSL